MKPLRHPFLLLAGVILAAGCSLDYQELAESLDEETPALRMEGVTVVTVEEGRERFRIQAESLEEFEEAFRRELAAATFTEYDSAGEVSAEGRADSISFDTRTDDAVLEGGIRFYSVADETTVRADYLEWNDGERRLSGGDGRDVALERADGTSLVGRGFSADFPSRTFRFSTGVAGTYVTGSDDGTESP